MVSIHAEQLKMNDQKISLQTGDRLWVAKVWLHKRDEDMITPH